MWKRILIGAGVVVALVVGGLSYLTGSPRDAYGFLRYGLMRLHRGDLRVGQPAPDVELVALDGTTRFHLREHMGARPLVLIFGSYT